MTFVGVLFASLVGSLHCATMCGAIAGCVGATVGGRHAGSWLRALAYHCARLGGYLLLGAFAGLLGAGIDAFGLAVAGVANVAAVAMGGALLWLAFRQLRPPPPRSTALVQLRPRKPLLSRWLPRGDITGAAAVGLLTAVLPCGWLWSFVVLAAARADAQAGAAVMFAMWIGTVPALMLVGVGSAWLGRVLGRHAPKITAAILVLLALASLTGRLVPVWTSQPGEEPPSCHS